ncbi:malto-oligosyltrehalose synthase [Rubrobacter radiotolerans]|uniref:Malto-oligosyltrehalose synthase n=1 Tax=Rubrobacter radiotolerans TaxID=42256 RepID=A0A023X0A7_RUBRA|nr:malto-oligosyltrehalose synthase [Rubrobacter radiotolerans]AHY45479.1 malto-oligosyltrehalose synthase [Rubrobacter radiotolerans]MDX5892890.1 malto-oligosyltrehalose synthase [Rubrobacter radiotolerans]SMC02694.1 (1->4)-alpha-D-glucan 1-alpha-D-glucosylmutase [Rubrobacter radiotolerans DSM 5868]
MRVPRATYRLQLNGEFTFQDAEGLVPYLARLGVSDLYASPYMEARSGSTHGYDIVDHGRLNPEIGTEEDYERLVNALHEHGMGQLLDWVPNHMGVGPDNSWWLDVLENGPASRYASFFDIEWRPANRSALHGKVLLPVLGDHYRSVLEGGELQLGFDAETGTLSVAYYEHVCPLDGRTYGLVLGEAEVPEGAAAEFGSLVTAFGNLPERERTDEESVEERSRDARINRERLAAMCASDPEVLEAVERRVAAVNAEAGLLHRLLEEQAYRLVYWRVAADEINYRRFFSVNDLAGIRVEDERVFEATHRFVLKLLREGKVNGLRLDHPDGLYSPAGYFERLQSAAERATGENIYLLVEKILAEHERLPEDWRVSGTTGYEFANLIMKVLLDSDSEAHLDETYRRFVEPDRPFEPDFGRLLYGCKLEVMRGELASELNVLSRRLLAISEGPNDERLYDFTINVLRDALMEVVAHFPVYRTYITGPDGISEADRRHVEWAISKARKTTTAADTSVFDFLRSVLLFERAEEGVAGFVGKFQQYTGPVMAKGMEDTALYRYNCLTALNEVGGEPEGFGVSVAAFHAETAERARRWPDAMLSTSTHDTKRSEDVRARILVLSELAQEWREALESWSLVNRSRRREVESGPAPSRNDEVLIYQTLLGAWPLEKDSEREEFTNRIKLYVEKAMRESGARTLWTKPDEEYEAAVMDFIEAILEDSETNLFLRELAPLRETVARLGALNSLSQTLVKLTAPGVPDLYQGNELWDFSLVDPDNRRPVDYAKRDGMLRRLEGMDPREAPGLLEGRNWRDGSPKLYLTWRALKLREERPDLFRRGEYVPLEASGEDAEGVLAFARTLGDEAAVTLAPRLFSRLADGSEGLALDAAALEGATLDLGDLPPGEYRNVLTGSRVAADGPVPVRELLGGFPVALLVRE